MTRTFRIVAALGLILGLVGCATSTTAKPVTHAAAPVVAVAAVDNTSSADSSFLTAIHNSVATTADDSSLLKVGNSVCSALMRNGSTTDVFTNIVITILDSGVFSATDAGNIIGASVGYLCPQFDDAALAFANSDGA